MCLFFFFLRLHVRSGDCLIDLLSLSLFLDSSHFLTQAFPPVCQYVSFSLSFLLVGLTVYDPLPVVAYQIKGRC